MALTNTGYLYPPGPEAAGLTIKTNPNYRREAENKCTSHHINLLKIS